MMGKELLEKLHKNLILCLVFQLLATVSVEEIASLVDTPKMFQFYFHKDRGLNDAVMERVKAAKFDVMALTVDTITGGNRERDLRTGFTSPPKLTLSSLI